MDRDDHRREVEPRVADVRRDEWVGAPEDPHRAAGRLRGRFGRRGSRRHLRRHWVVRHRPCRRLRDRWMRLVQDVPQPGSTGGGIVRARPHPSDHEQGARMIPTEPIGSIPRPKTLIDGQAAFAEGTISPEELRALQDEALADTIRRFEETGSPVDLGRRADQVELRDLSARRRNEPRGRRRRDPVRGWPHAAAADPRVGTVPVRDLRGELRAAGEEARATCRSSRPSSPRRR